MSAVLEALNFQTAICHLRRRWNISAQSHGLSWSEAIRLESCGFQVCQEIARVPFCAAEVQGQAPPFLPHPVFLSLPANPRIPWTGPPSEAGNNNGDHIKDIVDAGDR